jgi:alpha-1,2-mannosyltransferase
MIAQGTRTTSELRERRLILIGLVVTSLAIAVLAQSFLAFNAHEVVDGETVYALDDVWAYDFEAYISAASRLADGGSLYQAETLSGPFRPGPYGLYMYSPTLGVALLPLTEMKVAESSIVWYLLHALALALACLVMPVRASVRLFAFAVASLSLPVIKDMALGNVSVLLLLPTVMAWRWLDHPLGSIAQAVAISVRPMLGILVFWQLLRRQWRAVAWTIGAAVVLMVVTLPFVGIAGYLDYLTVLRNMSDVTGVLRNVDIGSALGAAGFSTEAATLGLLAGYAIAISAILVSLRRDREVGFMVTLMASLLLSPLLWDHYLVLIILPAAFLAERGRPWALALPLLLWLPPGIAPIAAIAGLVLPFLARDREPAATTVAARLAPSGLPSAPAR